MAGFSLFEKTRLILSLKKSNIYQLRELRELINKEILRRKRKESKGLKNA